MPAMSRDDTSELLERTSWGDTQARDRLLERHRAKLRTMVSVRLDRRLRARVDPSDVVQDVLHEAARNLGAYLDDRAVPFHVWLRELAFKRMVDLRRRHVKAQRRSVLREQQMDLGLSDESTAALVSLVAASGTSPSNRMIQAEMHSKALLAIESLAPIDREVLILRHLERLSLKETAEALGIKTNAAATRHTRALTRLRELLDDERKAGQP